MVLIFLFSKYLNMSNYETFFPNPKINKKKIGRIQRKDREINNDFQNYYSLEIYGMNFVLLVFDF